MKKKLGRITRLNERSSYVVIDNLLGRTKQDCTVHTASSIHDKPNILISGNKSERTMKPAEPNIGREKHTYNQKDSRQGDNAFSIENYSELLVQKLKPLNNNSTRIIDHYPLMINLIMPNKCR